MGFLSGSAIGAAVCGGPSYSETAVGWDDGEGLGAGGTGVGSAAVGFVAAGRLAFPRAGATCCGIEAAGIEGLGADDRFRTIASPASRAIPSPPTSTTAVPRLAGDAACAIGERRLSPTPWLRVERDDGDDGKTASAAIGGIVCAARASALNEKPACKLLATCRIVGRPPGSLRSMDMISSSMALGTNVDGVCW